MYGKNPKVTGTSMVAFLKGQLKDQGITNPDAVERLTIKYMNTYFWGK
jgi:hypothetical protein